MNTHTPGADSELLPCPFCGSAKVVLSTDMKSGDSDTLCTQCGAAAPNPTWNKRATASVSLLRELRRVIVLAHANHNARGISITQGALNKLLEDSLSAIDHNLAYPECSGDPACCPENEGYGCCMPNPPTSGGAAPVMEGAQREAVAWRWLYSDGQVSAWQLNNFPDTALVEKAAASTNPRGLVQYAYAAPPSSDRAQPVQCDDIGIFEEALRRVEANYPLSVFPEDGESLDCKSASMARLTCRNVRYELERLMADRIEPDRAQPERVEAGAETAALRRVYEAARRYFRNEAEYAVVCTNNLNRIRDAIEDVKLIDGGYEPAPPTDASGGVTEDQYERANVAHEAYKATLLSMGHEMHTESLLPMYAALEAADQRAEALQAKVDAAQNALRLIHGAAIGKDELNVTADDRVSACRILAEVGLEALAIVKVTRQPVDMDALAKNYSAQPNLVGDK